MRSSPRHRHFVALPLMSLMLVSVGAFNQIVSATASVATVSSDLTVVSTDEEKQLSLPQGMTLLLSPQSHLLVAAAGKVQLLRGSVLMSASGFASVDAGFGVTGKVLMGSVLLVRDDTSATLVALLAPAVVTFQGQNLIVPAGYQLRIDSDGTVKRTKAPSDWLAEQIARAHALPMAEEEDLSSGTTGTLPDTAESALIALQFAITGDTSDADASGLVVDPLRSADFPATDLTLAVPALALTSLRPLPPALIDFWAENTIRSAAGDSVSTVTLLHPLITVLPSRYRDAGYPKQAELWSSAIAHVGDVMLPLLSGGSRDQFAADLSAAREDLPVVPAVTGAPVTASVPDHAVHTHSREELEALARALLLEKGALFTGATMIEPDDTLADCAQVSGVFLQEDNQDVPYEFSLCPFDQTVHAIKRAGIALPNTVKVDQFFR